jgi:glutamate-1-semialdehyde 2,1-aminomutase
MKKSSETYSRLLEVTPCGSQTLSKMPSRFIRGVYPEVLARGQSAHVWDEDGNEYVDLIAGLGCVSVGYVIDDINFDVEAQLRKGVTFSLPHKLEGLVSRKLIDLVPNTEMWKFGKNGTDATVMAVRAARAFTGRMKVLSVGYNGCADVFEAVGTRRAGIPDVLGQLIHKAVYNDIESFQSLRDGTYACLIMEPMVYEYPKPGFLQAVRELCTDTGTVLIFDEVVTGGRFDQFTAQSYFKVIPDLTTLGKAIANGFPLSAVGGVRRIMQTFERDDFFASGTFGGETISLAACLPTLDILNKTLEETIKKGRHIQDFFNDMFVGLATCEGYPTRLIFKFPTKTHNALFMQEMCLKGVLIGAANMVMSSITEADLSRLNGAIHASYLVLKDNWANPLAAMKGPLPEDALRK